MKKLFSILFALLLAASMLSGCSSDDTAADADDTTTSGEETAESGAAEISGDIMIYTSAEDAFISEVCAMFNEKYPEANAQYYRSGTEEVISKIMAEKMTNSLQADLIMVSDAPTFESLKANDLLQPYDSPELDNIYTEFVDPEHYYYGTFPAAMGIVYNTNLVTEAPTSWLDLLSEDAKANTVMPNPLYSGTAANALMELTRAGGLGWDYYQGLYDNEVMVVNGNGGVIKAGATGERTYGMCLDTDTLSAMNDGSPLAFVYPREGCSSICDPIAIMKYAPNSDMARLFVDFMLSREVREFAAQNYYKTAPRTDVAVPQGALSVEDRKMLYIDPRDLLGTKEADKQKFDVMFNQSP